METEIVVKLEPKLAAWIDKRARGAYRCVCNHRRRFGGDAAKRRAKSQDTAELMRKLEEKYPVSADILALKGSLRLSSAEPNVDAIRYEYLWEKYGL